MYEYPSSNEDKENVNRILNYMMNFLLNKDMVYRVICSNSILVVILYDKSDMIKFINKFIPKSTADISGIYKNGRSLIFESKSTRDIVIKKVIEDYENVKCGPPSFSLKR